MGTAGNNGEPRAHWAREPRMIGKGNMNPKIDFTDNRLLQELLTINCQGTNHPKRILSFMDISILFILISGILLYVLWLFSYINLIFLYPVTPDGRE